MKHAPTFEQAIRRALTRFLRGPMRLTADRNGRKVRAWRVPGTPEHARYSMLADNLARAERGATTPRAGDPLPTIRRGGREIIRTISPATGEVLEWNPNACRWESYRGPLCLPVGIEPGGPR